MRSLPAGQNGVSTNKLTLPLRYLSAFVALPLRYLSAFPAPVETDSSNRATPLRMTLNPQRSYSESQRDLKTAMSQKRKSPDPKIEAIRDTNLFDCLGLGHARNCDGATNPTTWLEARTHDRDGRGTENDHEQNRKEEDNHWHCQLWWKCCRLLLSI